jgi:hypothetical protein
MASNVFLQNLGGRLPDWLNEETAYQPPQDYGQFPSPVLATIGDNPFERAAYATRRSASGSREEGPGTEYVERAFGLPKTPLEVGLKVAFGPFGGPLTKMGALALGGLLQSTDAEAGPKLPKLPKTLGALGRDVAPPGIGHNQGPPLVDWRDAPNPLAPMPQYAKEYPAVGPPVWKPKEEPSFPGEMYEAKQLTPEAAKFDKARSKIMRDMEKKGFQPYFDPEKRGLVDYTKYPNPNTDTSTIRPTREDTVKKYTDAIDAPETRARLEAAIARGEELGGANNWYFMNQLEHEYIKELGPKAGRAAFLDEFAVPMAATTSGQRPGPNLMTAHYLEYLRKNNMEFPTAAHQMPAPIGGRRAAVNIRDYLAMREKGGYAGLGEDQPKMHDFSRSLIGDLRNPVVDEQMAGGMLKGQKSELISGARNTAYGQLQDPIRAAAAERGLLPGAVQDVAWAGFKGEPGKPMIQIVNEAIERTHRLTGMPRSEIVRRALVRKEIPLYATMGLIGGKAAMGGGEPTGE